MHRRDKETVPVGKRRLQAGEATIEAAVALPGFLMALLALCSLISYPLTCLRVEQAMSDTARLVGMAGYVSQLLGVTLLDGKIEEIAQSGFIPGEKELLAAEDLMDALGMESGDKRRLATLFDIYRHWARELTARSGERADTLMGDVVRKAAEELVMWRLTARQAEGEASPRSGRDPWDRLGVVGGAAGVDFSESKLSSQTNELVLVASYRLRPRLIFGLAPAIRCRSQVQVKLWGPGIGQALRDIPAAAGEGTQPAGPGDSLWNHANTVSFSFTRGRLIEQQELARLSDACRQAGEWFVGMDAFQSGFDACSGIPGDSGTVLWQVVSLNPFLKSYQENPAAVRRVLREHLSDMPQPGTLLPDTQGEGTWKVLSRRLILVVPENAPGWVMDTVSSMMAELLLERAAIELRPAYGSYKPDQS